MYLVGNVLFDADDVILEHVQRRIPNAGVFSSERRTLVTATLGVVAGGRIVGGALFFNWRGHDIEVAAAFEGMTWARPATLRTLFAYPFVQLGCVRATALTARSNKRARRFLERIGCRLEGVKRKGFDGKQDALVYGLLRDDCRWLKHDVPVTLGLAPIARRDARERALDALDPTYGIPALVGWVERKRDPTPTAEGID